MYVVFALIVLAAVAIPFVLSIRSLKKTGSARKAVKVNLIAFAAVALLCAAAPFMASAAPAEEAGATPTATASQEAAGGTTDKGIGYIAAALAVGLSGIGGGISVAAAAPAAIGATSEDQKNFAKSLIFVALGEGIALYGLVVSILILFT
nr:ATP synthase subunit C [uncultured Solibaculum sp.]